MKKLIILKWASVCIGLGLIIWLGFVISEPFLKFVSEPQKFRLWVDTNGVWGRLAFIGMTVLQILIALVPGEPFEMVAGYAFGAVEGTLLCLISATIGSILVIIFTRKIGIKMVQLFFSKEQIESVKFLRSSPKRTFLFSIIFIMPGTPKDLLCYFAGLTDIKIWKLISICSLGRIPSIITSTLGGDALGTKSYILAIIVLVITALISLVGVLIYKKIGKKENNVS